MYDLQAQIMCIKRDVLPILECPQYIMPIDFMSRYFWWTLEQQSNQEGKIKANVLCSIERLQ